MTATETIQTLRFPTAQAARAALEAAGAVKAKGNLYAFGLAQVRVYKRGADAWALAVVSDLVSYYTDEVADALWAQAKVVRV